MEREEQLKCTGRLAACSRGSSATDQDSGSHLNGAAHVGANARETSGTAEK